MATKVISWGTGTGNITVTYTGQGDGAISITSDPNSLYEARSKVITVKTTDGSNIQRTVTIQQAAKVKIDISTATVTASAQTYSGSALTPTVHVVLNGAIVDESGYDVAYSNNINAGTATITVTGKGDYTGIATGTFTINKANPVYTAPTANNRTYNASSAALLVAGSYITPGSFTYSTSQSGTYSTTIPSQTNAGTYTTWWKFTPTDTSNYNSVSATSISTTIAQATGVVSTAPTARSVTYTGSSQYLVTAGSGTGTMYYRYKLSTSSSWSSWSISRPSRINAGTYNIEYYAAASSDGNYTQSATGSLNVTMNKASRTLSFANPYYWQNTSTSTTRTATPSAGSGDGAITYSISSTTYATINSSSGAVTSKTSDGSATVTATIAAGTNYQSATASYKLYVTHLLNGFTMFNDTGKGYEDATGINTALRFHSPSTVTYRVYNGTLVELTARDTWSTVTPTNTVTEGGVTVNEYVNASSFDDRSGKKGFLYSKSTTKIEFISNGSILVPIFNMSSNTVIARNRVTLGNYLSAPTGYFLVGRNKFTESLSTKDWSDLVNVTNPSHLATDLYYQIRLAGNMTGDVADFKTGAEKILNENPRLDLTVYESNSITGSIKSVLDYLAPRMSSGKKITINITGRSSDSYNGVTVTFDGQGGYST